MTWFSGEAEDGNLDFLLFRDRHSAPIELQYKDVSTLLAHPTAFARLKEFALLVGIARWARERGVPVKMLGHPMTVMRNESLVSAWPAWYYDDYGLHPFGAMEMSSLKQGNLRRLARCMAELRRLYPEVELHAWSAGIVKRFAEYWSGLFGYEAPDEILVEMYELLKASAGARDGAEIDSYVIEFWTRANDWYRELAAG